MLAGHALIKPPTAFAEFYVWQIDLENKGIQGKRFGFCGLCGFEPCGILLLKVIFRKCIMGIGNSLDEGNWLASKES